MSKLPIKSILSSSIGNALEWYEYTLYAYFASVITKLFFPINDHSVGTILTFATFAIGLAARPIGGIIFGYMGDRYSRKQTMAMTMMLMSIPTMLIGFLPTYEQIGIAAPILLILLRIVQGVALGGEFGSSCVYLFESGPRDKRGFYGALGNTGVGVGLVLSACTIFIVEAMVTEEALYSYAWRIPFFVSVVGSFIAYYMRKNLLETEDFITAKQTGNLIRNPFMEMLRNHKATLLSLFSIFLTTQISFFVVFIYGKTMMMDFLNYDSYKAGKFSLFTVISYTVATLVFGYLADKISRKYMLLTGAVVMFFASSPFIDSLKGGDESQILFMCLLMGALIGMMECTLNSFTSESFPTNIRATAVAFCWNFTAVAFGGAAPIISMWLIEHGGGVDMVGYYLMSVCAVTIIGIGASSLRRARTVESSVVKA